MRHAILLIIFLMANTVLAQDDEDCLVFTDALLKNGDMVQANVPAIGDDPNLLLEKFIALQEVRHFMITSLHDSIPCHEEPALSLLDATLSYQDYITLRLGQKLIKDIPFIEETLEAADSSYDTYDAFWNPPDV